MPSLRVRKLPVLASGLGAARRASALGARSYSALRAGSSSSYQKSTSLAALRAGAQTRCSSLYKVQVQPFSSSPAQYETIVQVPPMAESISEGTLSSFSKQVGDFVAQDEEIASIETDKIDVAVNAPESGIITELLVSEGDTVTVGQNIAKLEPGEGGGAAAAPAPKAPAKEPEPAAAPATPAPAAPATPAAPAAPAAPEPKKEAAAPPSPPAPKQESKPAPPKEAKPAKQDEPVGVSFGQYSRNETRVKMNRMRLRIAERLKQSQNTAASLTTFNEVDMSSIIEFRKLYKDEVLKETGVKLGFMSAFSLASVKALKAVPAVNASIEGPNGGDTIVYRDYVDISVAVSTPKGLVTPVVRNAESRSMIEIEQEIANLSKKARDGKLTIEDMAGGSFTISNGGVFGSMMGTPIINLPQTAVLGLHGIKDRAVVHNGKIEIRPMMYLALTYDHRLLDGREAVTFLVKIKEYIEDPRKLLLA